jgi:hypothetical protein
MSNESDNELIEDCCRIYFETVTNASLKVYGLTVTITSWEHFKIEYNDAALVIWSGITAVLKELGEVDSGKRG